MRGRGRTPRGQGRAHGGDLCAPLPRGRNPLGPITHGLPILWSELGAARPVEHPPALPKPRFWGSQSGRVQGSAAAGSPRGVQTGMGDDKTGLLIPLGITWGCGTGLWSH